MEAIISKYKTKAPASAALLDKLQSYVEKKLWNEFTNSILEFIFTPAVRPLIEFDFYSNFIKNFQSNLDQIKFLKIVYVVTQNLSDQQAQTFLVDLQSKSYFSEQPKIIVKSLQGCKLVNIDLDQCSTILQSLKSDIQGKTNYDNFVYFAFYRFSFLYYRKKGNFKEFYSNTLQCLAYSTVQEVLQNQKNNLSLQMALSVLVSPQMYNFSELIQQPLLKSLGNTSDKWAYDALRIFSRGNIKEYDGLMKTAGANNKLLQENQKILGIKIRLMAFLELLFQLPKNQRVVSFEKIAKQCTIPVDQVQTMLMKSMALNLVKGKIDQIRQNITVTWIIPRVLDGDSIKVMRDKFQRWSGDLKQIIKTVKDPAFIADQ